MKNHSKQGVTEILIAILAVFSVFTILIEYVFVLSYDQIILTYIIDLCIVVVLAIDLYLRCRASEQGARYLITHWYEVLALIPALAFALVESQPVFGAALRSLRLVRFVRVLAAAPRLVRALSMIVSIVKFSRLAYMLAFSVLIIIFGGLSVFLVESHHEGAKISNLIDAFWWALATVTTVGYGDVVPITLEGRILGSILMISGIAVLGLFISTLGATLIERRLKREPAGLVGETKDFIKNRIEVLETLTLDELETLITMMKSLHGSTRRTKESTHEHNS